MDLEIKRILYSFLYSYGLFYFIIYIYIGYEIKKEKKSISTYFCYFFNN